MFNKSMFNQSVLVATAVAASLGLQSGAASSASNTFDAAAPTVAVQQVDFSGRPPFKRRTVMVPVTDLAVLEPPAAGGEVIEVSQVVRRGRPPFKRSRVTVPVVDVAALETVEANKPRRRSLFRGRPPFGQ